MDEKLFSAFISNIPLHITSEEQLKKIFPKCVKCNFNDKKETGFLHFADEISCNEYIKTGIFVCFLLI
jgi:hypothetical protein